MRTATIATLPIFSLASDTTYVPVNIDDMLAASDLPGYNNIGALGEAFHNAWTHCHKKTNDWIINELNVATEDPSFDNGYYVEYDIKNRVPATYELFREILGKDNYWPAPVFAKDSLDFTQGKIPAHMNYVQDPKSYLINNDQEWIEV